MWKIVLGDTNKNPGGEPRGLPATVDVVDLFNQIVWDSQLTRATTTEKDPIWVGSQGCSNPLDYLIQHRIPNPVCACTHGIYLSVASFTSVSRYVL